MKKKINVGIKKSIMERLNKTNQENYSSQETFNREEAYIRAEKKLKELKGFYWHLFWYAAVNIFLWVSIIRNLDADESFFQYGHFATAFFWGIGVFFHWFGVFGKHFSFSKDWEKRKIQEFLDKENNL
jgi:hypothetical protein